MKKEKVNEKILQVKKKNIIEKIEDLNAVQSSLRHRLLDLEKKKNDLSESKYQKHKKKLTKKVEKIRGKIHDLEGKLEKIKHSSKK